MQLDGMKRGAGGVKHLAQGLGQSSGPFGLSFRTEDQILPQLDQRMGQSARRSVPVERIAFQLARIGHVVADLDARNRPQRVEQRESEPRVPVPQDADRPGTGHPFQAWVKLCTETMTGGFPSKIAASTARSIAWW